MAPASPPDAPRKPAKMHALARQGFDGSGSSGLYDRARPTYPVPAIRALLDAGTPEPPAPLRIVELGAGTGICSRMLLEHATSPAAAGNPPPGLASLMAVEPSSGMREHFEKSIVQDLVETMKAKALLAPSAEVSVEEGAFEDFDVGQGFDLVVVAQAWHWCQDFDAALKSIAHALRPGGVLALIWNLEDRDAAPWVAKLRDMYEVYEDNTPQYRHKYWHAMYKAPSMSLFDAHPTQIFTRALPTTLQGVKDRVHSKSYISVLPEEKRQDLSKRIEDMFENGGSELGRTWVDEKQGVWEYPYSTDLLLFKKKA